MKMCEQQDGGRQDMLGASQLTREQGPAAAKVVLCVYVFAVMLHMICTHMYNNVPWGKR
jgi:predicted membrane channel-forming protein YqfA (hemolysin III family)